ncbi:alpha/beta fold hydrolase [Peristeroidobacter soli]|uniref:alpha/beta fold hydrolase n=1 Tax=Peristeroidobacter soli TaxID=2497877 RepID=UPI00101BE615|nr:alpha/beta hydrolase [Peristeroidobacter soli]
MGATLSGAQYIEVDGASLRARSAGAGPAVVLVHGWALDLEMWRAQIDLLADRYHVIAFDRRGFGRSSGVPGLEQDVHDIERVMDAFSVSSAALVGMSQGARVALRWALKHPERISCLVLDGPPAEGWPQSVGAKEIPIDEYRQRIGVGGVDAFRSMWLQHPFMKLHTGSPCAHALLREIVVRYPALDLLNEPAELPLLCERDLQRVSVPTLILSGEHDSPQRRSIAARMTRALPEARLRVLSGVGHLGALDDPVSYVQALRDFFSGQPAMSAGAAL